MTKHSATQPESVLSDACGHHCGKKDGMIGHCPCVECHDVARIRANPVRVKL